MVLMCAVGARLVLLPLAGVLVDRWDVRTAVLAADLIRCAVQGFVAVQFLSGHPSIAGIAGAEILSGAASAIGLCGLSPLVAGSVAQGPGRGRANALTGVGRSASQLLGPIMAGVLVLTVGVGWVFVLDSAAFASGAATLADKGYQGHATLHPIKKPRREDLSTHDKRHNGSLSSIRSAVERANAHLKNWKILATPYRPPLHEFAEVLQAVVGLYFLKWSYE
jgi:hypothetical protein